jgi:hypothetical protein
MAEVPGPPIIPTFSGSDRFACPRPARNDCFARHNRIRTQNDGTVLRDDFTRFRLKARGAVPISMVKASSVLQLSRAKRTVSALAKFEPSCESKSAISINPCPTARVCPPSVPHFVLEFPPRLW